MFLLNPSLQWDAQVPRLIARLPEGHKTRKPGSQLSECPCPQCPTRYGQLSLELSLQPLADNVRAAPSAALHLAHPTDWCGVLRFAADFGELQVLGVAELLRNWG